MSQDTFSSQWHDIKDFVKKEWDQISDVDLKKINGKKDELIGLLQKKYGYAKDIAEARVSEFMENLEDKVSEQTKQIYQTCSKCMNSMEEKVRQNPLASIGAAFGIGFLLDRFIRLLMSNDK